MESTFGLPTAHDRVGSARCDDLCQPTTNGDSDVGCSRPPDLAEARRFRWLAVPPLIPQSCRASACTVGVVW